MELRRIDTHCHVHFPAYDEDRAGLLARTLGEGTGMITVGTELSTSRGAVALAERQDGVWAAVGFHPSHVAGGYHDEAELGDRRAEAFDAAAFRELLRSSRKIVGIGECGLDRRHLAADADEAAERAAQAAVFRAQADLALEFDLPLIVHCRDLHREIFMILAEYRAAGRPLRGVAHCFTGRLAEARQYVDFGFYVSFAGVLTYKPRVVDRERGETLLDVAAALPLDRLLIETDAPYLAPAPHRGERNEPAYVKFVAERLAELRGLPVAEVEAATLANAKACFKSLDNI
jgi:TatD DNase family protein